MEASNPTRPTRSGRTTSRPELTATPTPARHRAIAHTTGVTSRRTTMSQASSAPRLTSPTPISAVNQPPTPTNVAPSATATKTISARQGSVAAGAKRRLARQLMKTVSQE
jgi:hypothetical protein